MTTFRLEPKASDRVDAIYDYTYGRWGASQADAYVNELFGEFARIAHRDILWQPLPAAFGLNGYRHGWRHYMIYWKPLADGMIGIVSVLHERMDQIERVRDDLDEAR